MLLAFGGYRTFDVVMLKWVLDEFGGLRLQVGYALQFVLGIKGVGSAPSRSEFNDLWCGAWDIVSFHVIYWLRPKGNMQVPWLRALNIFV